MKKKSKRHSQEKAEDKEPHKEAQENNFTTLINAWVKEGENKKSKKEDESSFYTSDHAKLFKFINQEEKISSMITPWISDINKPQSVLHSKNLVMGLKFSYKEFKIEYRLDYDNKKGLHINIVE